MGAIIVSTLVTLDGVMEAPGGEPGHPHSGWAAPYMGDAEVECKFEEVQEVESLLLGRVTYESFAGAWPTYEGAFADRMNSMPKQVVSTTLKHPEWTNVSVIDGDFLARIKQLAAAPGGPILVNGSRRLAHALFENELVDELRIMVFPVTVGSGFRLFPDSPKKMTLGLKEVRTFESGVVLHTYSRP